MTKLCRVCRKRKEITEFHKRKAYKDGYDTRCKMCELEYDRKRTESFKIEVVTKQCTKCKETKPSACFDKRLRSKDGLRNRCKACESEDKKIYEASDIGKYNRKLSKLKQKYGLNPDKYLEMLQSQNFRCQICEKEVKLVVDHCHITNDIRGLLCTRCNTGLGMFEDNKLFLENAIRYINKHE